MLFRPHMAVNPSNAISRSVTFAAAILGVASLASRLAGVLRDRLLSGTFGAGAELDAYYAAFRAPDLMYNVVVLGAVTAGFIPVLAKRASEGGEGAALAASAQRLASSLFTVIGAALAGVSAAGVLFAPAIVPFVAPGFDDAQRALTADLTRVMFASTFFLGLSAVFGGVLQTYRRFAVYAFAPVLYNVGIILGTWILGPTAGVHGVALGVVFGAFLHAAAQYAACRSLGFRFAFRWDLRSEDMREIGRVIVPRTAALGVSQINLVLLTAAASTLGAGSLAVFTFANNLQSLPIGILGVSFAVAAFPLVSELAAKDDRAAMVAAFSRTVRTVMFLVIPATVLFLLLRAQIVRVVLGTGSFDWNDTIDTADTLSFFTVSMFAQALIPLVARTFFALRDVKTPLLTAAIGVVVERVLAWQLMRAGFGAPGLALAFSVGTVVNLALLWTALSQRVGGMDEKRTFRAIALMSMAAVPMAAVVQLSKIGVSQLVDMRTFVGIFTQGAVAGAAGIAVYVGVAFLMGSEEAREVARLYRRRTAAVPAEAIRQDAETIATE